eukprot:Rhum_TRINITY_DN14828_c0_g1::Rhum_TRINITY_DN14828_c0_g1_i1::g.123761::m.123761
MLDETSSSGGHGWHWAKSPGPQIPDVNVSSVTGMSTPPQGGTPGSTPRTPPATRKTPQCPKTPHHQKTPQSKARRYTPSGAPLPRPSSVCVSPMQLCDRTITSPDQDTSYSGSTESRAWRPLTSTLPSAATPTSCIRQFSHKDRKPASSSSTRGSPASVSLSSGSPSTFSLHAARGGGRPCASIEGLLKTSQQQQPQSLSLSPNDRHLSPVIQQLPAQRVRSCTLDMSSGSPPSYAGFSLSRRRNSTAGVGQHGGCGGGGCGGGGAAAAAAPPMTASSAASSSLRGFLAGGSSCSERGTASGTYGTPVSSLIAPSPYDRTLGSAGDAPKGAAAPFGCGGCEVARACDFGDAANTSLESAGGGGGGGSGAGGGGDDGAPSSDLSLLGSFHNPPMHSLSQGAVSFTDEDTEDTIGSPPTAAKPVEAVVGGNGGGGGGGGGSSPVPIPTQPMHGQLAGSSSSGVVAADLGGGGFSFVPSVPSAADSKATYDRYAGEFAEVRELEGQTPHVRCSVARNHCDKGEYLIKRVRVATDPLVKNGSESPLSQLSGASDSNTAELSAQCKGEIDLYMLVETPHIPRYFNCWFDPGWFCIQLEHTHPGAVRHEPPYNYVKDATLLRIANHVGTALQEAHDKQLCHGQVSPAVLHCSSSGRMPLGVWKLADWSKVRIGGSEDMLEDIRALGRALCSLTHPDVPSSTDHTTVMNFLKAMQDGEYDTARNVVAVSGNLMTSPDLPKCTWLAATADAPRC